MNFYVASSFRNIEQVRTLSRELALNGHHHTYDWTQAGGADSLEALAAIGAKEKDAVMDADLLVVLLPAGKGSHIELGIALGLGKRIYIYSSTNDIYDCEKTSTFYHIEGVNKFVGSLDLFTQYLMEKEAQV